MLIVSRLQVEEAVLIIQLGLKQLVLREFRTGIFVFAARVAAA